MKEEALALDDVPTISDAEEIIGRPQYRASLYFHPKHNGRHFGSIVAPYHLSGAKIKCGISDCGSPHWHGYIITTSDGLETNIGKDCGAKHFKADFASEKRRHDELYERRLKIGKILALKAEASSILEDLESLQNEYNFLKSLRYKLRGALSAPESQKISYKLKTGDQNLYRYEAKTQQEREAFLAANPSSRKSGAIPPNEIKIGEIAGFPFLGATHKDEEVFNYIQPLRNLEQASEQQIMAWRKGEINKTHTWFGSAKKMEVVRSLIEHGNQFFTESNLKGLAHIGISEESLATAITEVRRHMATAGRKLA